MQLQQSLWAVGHQLSDSSREQYSSTPATAVSELACQDYQRGGRPQESHRERKTERKKAATTQERERSPPRTVDQAAGATVGSHGGVPFD
jgi:hypothetical protein